MKIKCNLKRKEFFVSIASICYLIEKSLKYEEDGRKKEIYKVCFPYQKNEKNWVRCIPEFNLFGSCTNESIVENIYDNYQDAVLASDKKNQEMINYLAFYFQYNENFYENLFQIRSIATEKINKYKSLEQKIKEETKNIPIKNTVTPQSIIIEENQEIKKLETSLYYYLKTTNSPFYVSTVTDFVFKSMCESIKKKEPNYINHNAYLLAYDFKNRIIRIIKDGLDTGYFIDKQKTIHQDKSQKGKDVREFFIEPHIYTTKNFEDIINAYQQYPDIILPEDPLKRNLKI